MPITEAYELDNVTVGATEISLVTGTTGTASITTGGAYQFWIDTTNLAKSDLFAFRIYDKVELTGGVQRKVFEVFLGEPKSVNYVSPTLVLMNGWDARLVRIAGADRAFDASVRRLGAVPIELYELDGVTIGATEWSVTRNASYSAASNQTADRVVQLWVDPAAMAKGDEFRIRGYEKVEATGGVARKFFEATLQGTQTEIFVTPAFTLMHGWDWTIQKITGTDRAFDATVRVLA